VPQDTPVPLQAAPTHVAHRWVAGSHDRPDAQSPSATHCTQALEAASQTRFVVDVQSPFCEHWTQ
jgi:hypothetical protein